MNDYDEARSLRRNGRHDARRVLILFALVASAGAFSAGCRIAEKLSGADHSNRQSEIRTAVTNERAKRSTIDTESTLQAWSQVDTLQAKADCVRLMTLARDLGQDEAQREFDALSLSRRKAVALALTPVHIVARVEEVPAANRSQEATGVSGVRAIRFYLDCYDAARNKAFTWNHQVDWAWSGGRVTWGGFNPWGTTHQSIYNYDGVFGRYQTNTGYPTWHTFSQGQFSSAFRLRISFKGIDIGLAKTWKPWIDVYVDGGGLYSWASGASAG